jgi:hypothetical protein
MTRASVSISDDFLYQRNFCEELNGNKRVYARSSME